ncbi:YuzB family protein [Isobaculum melis]|uniref:Uncharacterized protein YuzB, UPF0349 family n=1 Tax=Isobaculum melis TaxID=142588 RepID=A0A1H9QSQ6_9LACT|nr:YuzB family protein [Isobaculum melis]SER62733.1 Uncharacterized protein YuzB, UPF0349 family [Isobaculum melis]
MLPMVEFCVNNVINGGEEVIAQLEKDGLVDVVVNNCLSECTTCAASLFAIAEGEVIHGESAQDLLTKIYRYLEEEDYL